MDTKTLLAFLLALPASTDTELANNSALKQLCNKLELLNRKSEITPKDWENIQGKLAAILESNAPLNQLYQERKAQLEGVEITSDLLPTLAELEAAKPANRKLGKLGYHPGEPPGDWDFKNNEITNIVTVVLSNEQPAKTSQTLLQKLIDLLKKQK
ncbi:hypothetical protein [Candidatus Parabeggiatoa sp. HSG14]|uniref:hypothetical protein n=1 Tax=Candidatus Parabeggiatoa sp. HSG14 TaxID=3055593 RepID=UPI0025A6D0FA|nr:hypothetical protein [Thiotrichales bacterium HSG14]